MFLSISDFYFPGSFALLVLLVLTVFRHIQAKKQQSEEASYQEEVRKKELTRIIETREERTNDQKFSEERFWKMIDDTTSRAKDGYTFQLGVLRDKLSNLEKDELIELDNLYSFLIEENINQDLTATTAIIFGDGSPSAAILLMNLFIMQGEVFFKNACHNPNLIIGKSFNALEGRTIQDLIADLYFKKTSTLIPLRPDNDEEGFKIPGKPWKQKELPSRYPELWEAFA
ncbi:DUF4240 domain-containing protein [Cryomorphaceae bacterium 1068]|nr:DUF4240 domain-containing protein [Cryomorphaceae bacterium 1068]